MTTRRQSELCGGSANWTRLYDITGLLSFSNTEHCSTIFLHGMNIRREMKSDNREDYMCIGDRQVAIVGMAMHGGSAIFCDLMTWNGFRCGGPHDVSCFGFRLP